MYDKNEKLNQIINSEKIDTQLALNILINAVKSNWDSFNKVDKFLISKILQTFQYHYDNNEDIVIKFSKD